MEENLDRHEILIELGEAKEYLREEYDIEELSTIEGVHLRHLVEQRLSEAKKNREEIKGLEREMKEQVKEKGVADPNLPCYTSCCMTYGILHRWTFVWSAKSPERNTQGSIVRIFVRLIISISNTYLPGERARKVEIGVLQRKIFLGIYFGF